VFLVRRDDTPSPEAEALAAYLDGLIEGDATASAPDPALGELAERLHADMRAVEPPADFVAELRLRLVAAADQRHPVVAEESVAAWRQPRFIIGAAGLVSAAAVIAFVARSRMMQPKAA
jgi:hypothetical protein